MTTLWKPHPTMKKTYVLKIGDLVEVLRFGDDNEPWVYHLTAVGRTFLDDDTEKPLEFEDLASVLDYFASLADDGYDFTRGGR